MAYDLEFEKPLADLEKKIIALQKKGDRLNLRILSSYLYDMIIDTGLGGTPINYRNQSGPVGAFGGFNSSPEWQLTAWVTYQHARFTNTLRPFWPRCCPY